jgi:histone deacetylase 1/2
VSRGGCGGGGRGGGRNGDANRGGRGGFGRGGGGRGSGRGDGGSFNNNNRPTCQLCGKIGHTVHKCWKRFDASFTGEDKSANVAALSYGVDTNWYINSGATDHITSELYKLTVKDKYAGNDQVHTTSGSGMDINHVSRTIIHTPTRKLYLNNVLHVLNTKKNLISAYRLMLDNHAFIELHPTFFLIKDQATKMSLLRGRCRAGLCPLPSSTLHNKQAQQVLGAFKVSPTLWHSWLGHPSSAIVDRVLSSNKLPVSSESTQNQVCNAC